MGDVVRFPNSEGTFISIGGPIDEARPSLCVYSDTLDPEQVTQLLGCLPTRSHRKDEVIGTRGNRAPTGAWILEPDTPRTNELEPQIASLLTRVTPDDRAWDKLIKDHRVVVSCMLSLREWSRGFSLSPQLLEKMATRGISLDCTIYYIGDGDA